MAPEKYRDRILRAALRLLDRNGGRERGKVKGDRQFMAAVDGILEEILDGAAPAGPQGRKRKRSQ